MKYKSIAAPKPSVGLDFSKVKELVLPDQSMSLQDILTRFTRGESLNLAHPVEYGSDASLFNDRDLEKLATSDLVDKEEYINHLKEIQSRYEKNEKKKASFEAAKKAEQDRIDRERLIRIKAKQLARKQPPKGSA